MESPHREHEGHILCDGEAFAGEACMQPYLCTRGAAWLGNRKATADPDLPSELLGCRGHFMLWSLQEPDAWTSYTWQETSTSPEVYTGAMG